MTRLLDDGQHIELSNGRVISIYDPIPIAHMGEIAALYKTAPRNTVAPPPKSTPQVPTRRPAVPMPRTGERPLPLLAANAMRSLGQASEPFVDKEERRKPFAPPPVPLQPRVEMVGFPSGVGGAPGAAGPRGAPGEAGPQGAAGSGGGSAGPQGPDGSQGSQGTMGSSGTAGPQGFQGSQGLTGSPGSTGPQGFQGFQGSTGPSGGSGPQGAQGPAGGGGGGAALLGFGGTGTSGAFKRWADGDNANAPATTDFTAQIEMTRAGTLKNLRVLRAAPGLGDSITFTVHKGGVATAIT